MKRAFFSIKDLNSNQSLYNNITEIIVENDHILMTNPNRFIALSELKAFELTWDDGKDVTFKIVLTNDEGWLVSSSYGTSQSCCDCIDEMKRICEKFVDKREPVDEKSWQEICSSQIGMEEKGEWQEIFSSQIVGEGNNNIENMESNVLRGTDNDIKMVNNSNNDINEELKKLQEFQRGSIKEYFGSYSSVGSKVQPSNKENNSENDLSNINTYRKALQNSTKDTSLTLEERLKKIEEIITSQKNQMEEYYNMVHVLQSTTKRTVYLLVSLILVLVFVTLK